MTIYDIAKSCGVSIATVSRVLNGSSKVRPQTREKVMAAMKEQQYTPNPFARGLGLDSMKMVGILCTDISDTFYSRATYLVEQELKKRGINMILSCTGHESNNRGRYLQFMLKQHVDAILLIGSPFHFEGADKYLNEATAKVPIVTINSVIEKENIYCVYCDEYSGIRDCTNQLIDRGYKKIVYLYDRLTFSGQQKMNGYKDALSSHGIAVDESLVANTRKEFEHTRQITAKLLADHPDIDAIVTSEDILAVGAQKALSEAGISLPVIGCNNSILAECSTPTITSLDNRLDVLCPTAAEILQKIVLNGQTSTIPSKTVFPPQLVARETFRTK